MSEARVDKWLWMVRIFKTRTLAAEACKKGRVHINQSEAKASKDVRVGDTISVRKPPVNYTFIVKGIPNNRVGAKLLPDYLENTTSDEELQKLDPGFLAFQGARERGMGRPTKKERRILDSIKDSVFDDWDDE
jgi:ribosome-associated heat shock protein Hsp15